MKILQFLTDLVTDTELMAAYRRSPEATLSSAGLTEQEQQLLLAGDPLAIRHAVNAENTPTLTHRLTGVETMIQAEISRRLRRPRRRVGMSNPIPAQHLIPHLIPHLVLRLSRRPM